MDTTRHSPDTSDTIVALSSAPGAGGRAIVRLSGPKSLEAITRVFNGADTGFPGRGVHAGELRLPQLHAAVPAHLHLSLAPRSYTGQDLVEVHLPGVPAIVECLIQNLLSSGVRSALPGEFTMRAFLAGKLDLTQAEGVLGILHATHRDELQQALSQLAGGVLGPMLRVREDLLCLLADLEAGLDFAEEDIHFVESADLLDRLESAARSVSDVLLQLRTRSVHARPVRVVLVGPPNAGKSSLFNAMLGKAAALTSPTAGTTRDYLREIKRLEGIDFELIDTAGLHESENWIEGQAQSLGAQQGAEADITLVCSVSGDFPIGNSPENGQESHLLIRTKCDLKQAEPDQLATSALTGVGLQELWARLVAEARQLMSRGTATHAARSAHHLEHTLHCLDRALLSVERNEPELVALEIRSALAELGELTGAVFTDDLLDRIFSRFCIGK
jgi:tRNA modification GTPase